MAIEKQDNGDQHTGLRAPLGWWGRATTFIAEVRSEMKRVTWPSRREVYATTVVVILTSAFFGLYLFGVDIVIGRTIQAIFDFGTA
jgi:preprotein translocase subunit SecE